MGISSSAKFMVGVHWDDLPEDIQESLSEDSEYCFECNGEEFYFEYACPYYDCRKVDRVWGVELPGFDYSDRMNIQSTVDDAVSMLTSLGISEEDIAIDAFPHVT